MICQSLSIIQLFLILNPTQYQLTRNLYNYHKTDQTQLFHELQVLNYILNYIFIASTQELWSYLKATLINARNISTPICKVSNEQSPRWHTSETRHLLKQIKTIRTSVQAGAVLMPLAMFLLSLKSIRVLY